MSQSSVLELIKVAKVDDTLRAQLESAKSSTQLKEIAMQQGYNFTEEEMISIFQEQGLLIVQEDGNLSEKELETVAGGGDWEISIGVKFKF